MSGTEWIAIGVAGVASAFDLRSARIPNALTFGAAAMALAFHALSPSGYGLAFALLGVVAGLCIFFPLFALGAMGAGDVKLMAALGGWLGWSTVLLVALYGSAAGGLLALIVAAANGYLRQALRNIYSLLTFWVLVGVKPLPALTLDSSTALRLPYAFPIAVGVMVTLWRQ